MEILRIENTKLTPLCEKCQNILKFKINHNEFNVKGECKNGHVFNDISFLDFKTNVVKTTSNIRKSYCYKCSKTQQSNNFLCQTCNKLFCLYCMSQHLKDENHKYVNYYEYDKTCQRHNISYAMFCVYCKENICTKCITNHKNHSIKKLIDMIPNNEEIKLMPWKAMYFGEKITKLNINIKEIKKLIEERYKKLENYLDFILYINKLYQNFNYSIIDYYNFENYNYINSLLNNETLFEGKRFLNYLAFGGGLEIDLDKKQTIKSDNMQKEENIKDNNEIIKADNMQKEVDKKNNTIYFNYYNDCFISMEYFKDNLFYNIKYKDRPYKEQYIKLYEYKDFSFNHILTYDLSYLRNIDTIKSAKYGNYFLINLKKKKKIIFLEYDCNNKNLTLSQKEIKLKDNIGFIKNFTDFIDLKNGDIITRDNGVLIVWGKTKKKCYEKKKVLSDTYFFMRLFNINENTFFSIIENHIVFFDCIEYEIIKFLFYEKKIDFSSTLNNELLLLKNNQKIILISLKFFEIVQKIELSRIYTPLKVGNNTLIQYYINNGDLNIIKNEFNKEKGCFNKEIVKKIRDVDFNFSKVIVTEDNKCVIFKNDMIMFFVDAF